jgi:hypothetical protein
MNYFGDDVAAPSVGGSTMVWILVAGAFAFFLFSDRKAARSQKRATQRRTDWEDEQEGRRMRKLREKK